MGNAPSTPTAPPSSSDTQSSPSPESACPVDPSARQAYLDAARSTASVSPTPEPASPPPPINPYNKMFLYGTPTTFLPDNPPPQHQPPPPNQPSPLDQTRTTSSIPRALTTTISAHSSPSPNSQTPNPETSTSGNWIYPSESQFFNAMKRKNHSPLPGDMSTIVPLHNAVNERVWHVIKAEWEMKYAAEENSPCGGPRLRQFQGKGGGRLSPRAKWLGLWGYEEPFDRHDWVVERCAGRGKEGEGGGERRVEYVIDFYRGRGAAGGKVGFFLDVRPKLNSWEGWRMRVRRFCGV